MSISVESLGEVSVAPHDGCFSSFWSKLNWDLIIDSVDPAIKSGGDDQLNNFFVLLGWSSSVGAHGNTEDSFFTSFSLTISESNVESEGSGGGGSSWDDSIFSSGEEVGKVGEGKDCMWHTSDSVPSFIVLLCEAGWQIGWGQEDCMDSCGQKESCKKIFDHDFIYIWYGEYTRIN